MAMPMEIGSQVLGKYQIIDLIAQGGEGLLAKATDQQTNQAVAVKQLLLDTANPDYPEQRARFERAAAIRIEHPHVLDPIESGEEGGSFLIVLPFIDGMNLDQYVKSGNGRLECKQAEPILRAVADGLQGIHDKKIIHRDIKPQNILIGTDGHEWITDFGICRDLGSQTITQGQKLLGTLAYMAPEQVTKCTEADSRSDIYALGGVFYFMLTGRPATEGHDGHSIVNSIYNTRPTPPSHTNPSVPAHIDELCLKMLAKHPDARFQQARDIVSALQNRFSTGVCSQERGFCVSCGSALFAEASYCHACGMALGSSKTMRCFCAACGSSTDGISACCFCHRTFSPADHRLAFQNGPLSGKICRLPEGIYSVGRRQLEPSNPHISRHHFSVACLNGQVLIEDAGSANKTYVGDRIASSVTTLSRGVTITIAGNTAIYLCN